MNKFFTPDVPEKYWLNSINYQCKSCRKSFVLQFANGDDIVKLESVMPVQIKWLPLLGKGGYLDLFEKFFPNHKSPMIPKVANEFINILNDYLEKVDPDQYFYLAYDKHQCKFCNSKDLNVLNDEVIENPELEWVRISSSIFDD